jgi:hypothetical protein
MGRRDEPELTPRDDELAADEAAVRRLLAPFGEPTQAEPPPGLAARVAVRVRQAAPAPAVRWQRPARWAAAALAALLLALGVWGVRVNSLGQLLLVFTLAAKPLVNLFAQAGLLAALAALAILAGAWLWWRLVRDTPLAAALERPV